MSAQAARLTILGSGTAAPSLRRGASGHLLRIGEDRLVFDTGPGTLDRLLKAGTNPHEVTHLFYSHNHLDHTGELAAWLFAARLPHAPRSRPLTIAGSAGFIEMFGALRAAYGHWIEAGTYRLDEIALDPVGRSTFRAKGWAVQAFPVDHIASSVGFRVALDGGKTFVYTGDTGPCAGLVDLCRDADLLLIEASMPDGAGIPGHLTPSEAGEAAARAGARRVVLTHFYPPCDRVDMLEQLRNTYEGEATPRRRRIVNQPMTMSRLTRTLPAAALLAVACAAPALAQVGQVNGTLTDRNHKPISGASVALIPKQVPTIFGTSSGVDGRYSFSGLPSDVVSVVVLPPGRTGRARKDGIRVRALFRSIVDFDLTETAVTDAPVPAPAAPGGAAAAPPKQATPAAPGADAAAAPKESAPPSPPGDAAAAPRESGAGAPAGEPPAPPDSSSAESPDTAPAEASPTNGGEEPAPASTLSCTVIGPDQKPVTEASVMVLPVKGEGTSRRGRTDGAGMCRLSEIAPGTYRILVRAPGFVTWYLGPVPLENTGDLKLQLMMAAYPLGFEGTLEDLLIPMEPIPPGAS